MDVILIPGFWLTGASWDPVVPALEAAGHRVRALTLPGKGDAPGDPTRIGLAARDCRASSSIVCQRWSRSFSSARSITSASARGAPIWSNTSGAIDGGCSVRCCESTPMKISHSNGTRLLTSWNRMQPIA